MNYKILTSECSERNKIDFENARVKNKYWWVCDKGHEYEANLGNRKYQGAAFGAFIGFVASFDNFILFTP